MSDDHPLSGISDLFDQAVLLLGQSYKLLLLYMAFKYFDELSK